MDIYDFTGTPTRPQNPQNPLITHPTHDEHTHPNTNTHPSYGQSTPMWEYVEWSQIVADINVSLFRQSSPQHPGPPANLHWQFQLWVKASLQWSFANINGFTLSHWPPSSPGQNPSQPASAHSTPHAQQQLPVDANMWVYASLQWPFMNINGFMLSHLHYPRQPAHISSTPQAPQHAISWAYPSFFFLSIIYYKYW